MTLIATPTRSTPERFNHEVTPEEAEIEFAKMAAREKGASEAAAFAGPAFERLLVLAETRDSGQVRRVVEFLATCYNSNAYRWDPSDLRCLDTAIMADVLAVLASQGGFAPYPYDLPGVESGEARLARVLDAWKPAKWTKVEA